MRKATKEKWKEGGDNFTFAKTPRGEQRRKQGTEGREERRGKFLDGHSVHTSNLLFL